MMFYINTLNDKVEKSWISLFRLVLGSVKFILWVLGENVRQDRTPNTRDPCLHPLGRRELLVLHQQGNNIEKWCLRNAYASGGNWKMRVGKEEQLLSEHLSLGIWQALKNFWGEREYLTLGPTNIHCSKSQFSKNLPSQYRWEYKCLHKYSSQHF